jgi:hypothetical protein
MLKSFELVIDSEHDEVEIYADTITGFLEAFEGLEDLFLMLAELIKWNTVVLGILAYKSTLRRLVVHGRSPGYLGHPDDGYIPTSTIEQLYGEIRLSCFGVVVSNATESIIVVVVWTLVAILASPRCHAGE